MLAAPAWRSVPRPASAASSALHFGVRWALPPRRPLHRPSRASPRLRGAPRRAPGSCSLPAGSATSLAGPRSLRGGGADGRTRGDPRARAGPPVPPSVAFAAPQPAQRASRSAGRPAAPSRCRRTSSQSRLAWASGAEGRYPEAMHEEATRRGVAPARSTAPRNARARRTGCSSSASASSEASGFVVNLVVYALFVHSIGVDYHVAAVVAWLVAVINNFVLNRHWTFDAGDGQRPLPGDPLPARQPRRLRRQPAAADRAGRERRHWPRFPPRRSPWPPPRP